MLKLLLTEKLNKATIKKKLSDHSNQHSLLPSLQDLVINIAAADTRHNVVTGTDVYYTPQGNTVIFLAEMVNIQFKTGLNSLH